MDFNSTAIGGDGDEASRNFYTPEEFGRSVRQALQVADEYVWIHIQIPRWWLSMGKAIKLPEGYADALRRARQGMAP